MRERIVDEARAWIGTPYLHQASLKGAGCDCLGLLRGVWRAIHGVEPERPPAYSMDWDEVAKTEVLLMAAERNLRPRGLKDLKAGDVLLFRMRSDAVAKHLGIFVGEGRFVHAYARHGVVENSLSSPWRRRIARVFAFPDRDELN